MITWLRVGLGVLVVAVATLSWGQHRQIKLQRTLIENQADAIRAANESLAKLADQAETNREQMGELLLSQSHVQSSLSARQQEIRRLQSDIKEIRDWADQPLPGDIVRLRQRPAARGASGYGQSVPAGGSVRAAGSEPEKKR